MKGAQGHMPADELKKAYRTAYLIAGSIKQTLSEEETEELDNWINASDENMRLYGELTDEKNIAATMAKFDRMNTEEELQRLKNKLS